MILTLNERTAFTATVLNFDKANEPVTPTTLRYRIDCKTTHTEVLGWTTLTPATEAQIYLTDEQTKVLNRRNASERKVITVQADAGLSTAFTSYQEFFVRRIEGF